MAIRLITGRLQQWSNVCKYKFTNLRNLSMSWAQIYKFTKFIDVLGREYLGDSGTRLQDTLGPGHRCFEDSLLISWD